MEIALFIAVGAATFWIAALAAMWILLPSRTRSPIWLLDALVTAVLMAGSVGLAMLLTRTPDVAAGAGWTAALWYILYRGYPSSLRIRLLRLPALAAAYLLCAGIGWLIAQTPFFRSSPGQGFTLALFVALSWRRDADRKYEASQEIAPSRPDNRPPFELTWNAELDETQRARTSAQGS